MANLIIKSSADNLVLQGSDASPAITVAAAGTTTFAENATLSGTANNLGTVTAGSIAGGSITSATTFPSSYGTGYTMGHITRMAFTTSTSLINTSSTGWQPTGVQVTIARATGTKAICWLQGGGPYTDASEQMHTTVYRDDTDNLSNATYGGARMYAGAGTIVIWPHSVCIVDTDTTISGDTNYECYFKSLGGHSIDFGATDRGSLTFLVQEVRP